jgi:hypothetical protein
MATTKWLYTTLAEIRKVLNLWRPFSGCKHVIYRAIPSTMEKFYSGTSPDFDGLDLISAVG